MHFIKRVKPIVWLALLSTCVIASFIIFLAVDHSSYASKLSINAGINTEDFIHKDITVNTELGQYPGLQLHTELKGSKEYTLSINYPFANIQPIDQPIQSWVNKQKDEFLAAVRLNQTNEDEQFTSHLNILVETNAITDGVYNIVLQAHQYTGGANGISFMKSFNFDIDKEQHLTLEDIFIHPNDDSFREKIASEIDTIITQNDDYNASIDEDLLQKNIESMEDWNWGITKEHFSLYYNEYEIGPGSLGNVIFPIDISRLHTHVQGSWLETFEMEEEIAERKRQEEERKAIEAAEKERAQQKESTPIDIDGKYIALTFDDGPHPDVTPRILDTLAAYNAKATFFMLGLQAEYHPELAAEVAKQGHEVASHSHSHTDLTLVGQEQLIKEISTTNTKIEQITGAKSVLFRPPYGAYNDQVVNIAQQNGLSIVLWSVDSLDWKNRNSHSVYSAVTANATVGSTVLLHDIHPTTADALPDVLQRLSEQGYSFVTVSELMQLQGQSDIGPF